MTTITAPNWLRDGVERIEQAAVLDRLAQQARPVAERMASGEAGAALSGRWLGHALHPVLTDLPLGCWIGSSLLDLVGGRGARGASRRLIGWGLLFVPPTAASGLVDWSSIDERRTSRVGVVHAVGNVVVATLYLASWQQRRRRHHLTGVALGLAGGVLAVGTGYLGGHLSFGRGAGIGERGLSADAVSSTAERLETPEA
jgi:uncharacterized membrane protein